jgi:adenine deaminase
MDGKFELEGQIVDVVGRRIFDGRIFIAEGRIVKVTEEPVEVKHYILPGLIDAHIHIESSMLIPSEFARLAVVHGTVATVSDPHEIANVLGIDGIRYMIANGKKTPFKFFFGASSCVPATPFETAGAALAVADVEELLAMDEIRYLSEMMNFPGVLAGDPEVKAKLALARKYGKPVDGHAPGLKGEDARKYIEAGITTDHECFTMEEALDKIKYGMKILVREGSAAKNLDELMGLLKLHPDQVMFCSDDKHPNDLASGHINDIVKRALQKGYDPITILRSCVYNPVRHYQLPVGMLQAGDPADLIIVNDLNGFRVLATYIDGIKVAENGATLLDSFPEKAPNKFNAIKISPEQVIVPAKGRRIRVLKALDGQLITETVEADACIRDGQVVSDTAKDVLKMLVMNRYAPAPPAVSFVQNFGLKSGAIASTVAHDSHNIIAVGTNDEDLVAAVNLLIDHKGGVSLVNGEEHLILPLPVAGIMSDQDGFNVASRYDLLDKKARELGSKLKAPYMTLSFMALLVIPQLKLSDKGLFDGNSFSFTDLFIS